MHALTQLLAGLALVHVLWALFYVTGTLLDRQPEGTQSGGAALLDVVIRTLTGTAMWGFATFVLGAVGALRWWGVVAALIAFGIAFRVRGENPLGADFWRVRARRFGTGWSWRALIVYYAVLATVVPAVLPDVDSDSQRVHLAYAADWANSGRIYIDYLLRASLYSDNIELLYALLDVVHGGVLVHFLVWFTGALSCVGVYSVLQLADDRMSAARSNVERVARDVVIILVPIAIAISPSVMRWNVTGMVDVPLGAFLFAPVLCAVAMLVERRPYFASMAVTAGFVAGAKPSLLVFVPAFIALAFASAAAVGGARRAAAITAVAMVLLGSPWYVRNLIVDGDPVPPEFNHLLHRADKMSSEQDQTGLAYFLNAEDRSQRAILTLPVRAWLRPSDPGLAHGEDGTTGIMVLLYAPFIVLVIALLYRREVGARPALIATAAMSALGAIYWVALSYNLRYFIPFLPGFAAFVGLALLDVAALGRFWPWVALPVAMFCVVPSPSAANWYRTVWSVSYTNLDTTLPSDDAFLERNLGGYRELELLMETPAFRRRPAGRVYQMRTEMDYEFRRRGVQSLGDWFGAARYGTLAAAIDDGELAAYVHHFDIGAFLIDERQSVLTARQQAELQRQLHAIGFVDVSPAPGDQYYIAVRER